MGVIEWADRECFVRQSPTALKGQIGYLSGAVGQREGRGWTNSPVGSWVCKSGDTTTATCG